MRDRWLVVSRLALRDPRLLIEYFQMSARSRLGGGEQRERGHITPAIDPAQARLHVAATVGSWSDGAALALVRRHQQLDAAGRAGATAERVAGDTDIAELLYGLVRALRPEVVVETGVATGVTSAYLLAALADNDAGELQSIDLPSADLVRAELVGCAVPAELQGRWTYHWGTSRRLLPAILDDTRGRRRVFIHDSEHTYSNMRWELACAWRALREGDWVMADDVHMNTAFGDLAAEVGADPTYVAKPGKGGCAGLLTKSAAEPGASR
jgi:predicted O-methyltransferase YrrM